MSTVHPTAIVERGAELGDGANIGRPEKNAGFKPEMMSGKCGNLPVGEMRRKYQRRSLGLVHGQGAVLGHAVIGDITLRASRVGER